MFTAVRDGEGMGEEVMSQPSLSPYLRRSSIPPRQPRYLRGSRAPEGPWRVGDVRAVGGRRTRSPRGAVIKKSCKKEKRNNNKMTGLLGEFHLCPPQLLRPAALEYTL